MSDPTGERTESVPTLSPNEALTVRALQVGILQADLEHSGKASVRARKGELLLEFSEAVLRDVSADPEPKWVPPELRIAATLPIRAQVEVLSGVGPALASRVSDRRTALVILAELITFAPWDGEYKSSDACRSAAVKAAAADLTGLRDGDLETMNNEFESLQKTLRRKSIRRGRIAAIAVAGAGLGVVTGGLAAPAIGAAVGSAMGLSGAAATSAGLAALGGGSLAAGGFGVAGGTFLVSGVGGVAFASAAAAGTRFSPLAYRGLVHEAVALDLVARMVLADAPDRDEQIRRVVESLQETINGLSDRTKLLVTKIENLKKQKSETDAENSALKQEIKELRDELADLKATESTLTVVRDRLPVAVSA